MERSTRGFSLLEVMIVVAISSGVLLAVYGILASTTRHEENLRRRTQRQIESVRAVKDIGGFLKRTGPADVDGAPGITHPADFPLIFPEGAPPAPYASTYPFLVHAPTTKQAAAGDPDFGPSWEFAFRLPQDLDLDGIPTRGTDGRIEWGPEIHLFRLVAGTGVWGPAVPVNDLEHRRYDASGGLLERRTLATHVERLAFESNAGVLNSNGTTGPAPALPGLAMNQVRVSIWLRWRDDRGRPLRLDSPLTVATFNYRSVE